ncbi:MAG: hypothetical protein ACKOD9_10910, partial [Rubrivivax sp.]
MERYRLNSLSSGTPKTLKPATFRIALGDQEKRLVSGRTIPLTLRAQARAAQRASPQLAILRPVTLRPVSQPGVAEVGHPNRLNSSTVFALKNAALSSKTTVAQRCWAVQRSILRWPL